MDESPQPPVVSAVAVAAHDAHGIVDERRAARFDGWTVEVQIGFIDALRATGSVAAACRAVGRGSTSAYLLRKRSESFAKAWASATRFNALDLERIAMERAVEGVETVFYDADGKRTRSRRRQSMGELNMMLRAAMPEKYGTPREAMRGETASAGRVRGAAGEINVGEAGPWPRAVAGGSGFIHHRSDADGPLGRAMRFDGTVADAQRRLDEALALNSAAMKVLGNVSRMLMAVGYTDSIQQFLIEAEAAIEERRKRVANSTLTTSIDNNVGSLSGSRY